MEYTFKAQAITRIIAILDLWPMPNRATARDINALADKLDFTNADKQAIGWQPIPNGSGYMYRPDDELVKELEEGDVGTLRHMVENPPDRLIWTRRERELQASVFEPLGLEPWFTSNKEQE